MKYIIDLSKLQNEADIEEIEYYCERYGTPLQAELEDIKAELHKRIGIQYDACFGDDEDVYCFHKVYQISHIIVDNVFEKYLKENKQ